MSQFPQWKRLLCGEEAEVVCSFCSPVKAPVFVLSHIVPELFQCHRLVRGKMQHYPSLLPWLLYRLISNHLKHNGFTFLLSSRSLKQRSDENAYLAFHVKVTPGWRSSAASCSETLYSLPSLFPWYWSMQTDLIPLDLRGEVWSACRVYLVIVLYKLSPHMTSSILFLTD